MRRFLILGVLLLVVLGVSVPSALAFEGVCISQGGTPIPSAAKKACEASGARFIERAEDLPERVSVCHSTAGTRFERLSPAECSAQGWAMREISRVELVGVVAEAAPRGASKQCRNGKWQTRCDEEGPSSVEVPKSGAADFEAALAAQAELRERCEAEWPADFRMQEHCFKRQQEGARKVNLWVQDPSVADNAELRAAVVACNDKWTDARGRNWPMIDHCIEQQVGAYRRLR